MLKYKNDEINIFANNIISKGHLKVLISVTITCNYKTELCFLIGTCKK